MNNKKIEEWRPIQGYEDYYQVSSLGRIRSLDRLGSNGKGIMLRKGRVLKLSKYKTGYLYVHLSKDNKQTIFKVHRLVAKAFPEICGLFREGLQIDHRNCVRDDNRAENLHWVTSSENNLNPITRQHKSDSKKGDKNPMYGGGEKNPMWGKFGKDHPASKAILQYDIEGNFIAEWDSAASAERELGICAANITHVLKGRSKTIHNFMFKYKTA